MLLLVLLIWGLFSLFFWCTFLHILNFSTSASTGTKPSSGGHQNSLVLFCNPNWQWMSSTVDWIPPCHGWKCLPSTAGKKKKKKRNLRDASCLSQGENCVGSRNLHNTSTVLASLYVPLRGTYEAEAIDSVDSLPSSVILWASFFL